MYLGLYFMIKCFVDMKNTTLGEFIRQIRVQKGISLRELARRADISPAFLSDIERDRRNPSDPILIKLAQQLDVHTKELQELNTTGALAEFKVIMDKDRGLGVAFANMVRDLKSGKVSSQSVQKKLR